MGLFGTYHTHEDIVSGNYMTSIDTYSAYHSLSITGSLDYRLSFLRRSVGLVPCVSVGATWTRESFDAISDAPGILWKMGVSISSQ